MTARTNRGHDTGQVECSMMQGVEVHCLVFLSVCLRLERFFRNSLRSASTFIQ